MLDLKAKPFYLSKEDIGWVERSLGALTRDEKLGQLFMDMLWGDTEENIRSRLDAYGMGGFRYTNLPKEALYRQNAAVQQYSKIPALIAANVENGGNGAVSGGTLMGDPVAIAAAGEPLYAYQLGYCGCREAAAVGCNWTFAPVVDVLYNWRNCVVSNRCFGSDPDTVLTMAKAYHHGAKDAGVACCMKHFPGDGCDERDQHIVTTINDLSCRDWDASFGKVYQGMIDDGIESVMVGHIQLPSCSRKLRPGIRDEEIMPATVAPELVTGLLREKLRFNGLIVTDATHMVGLSSKMRRSEFVPGCIMAGCDMILYYRDKDEDMDSLRAALSSGVLTMARVDEAVTRILAFKAMLGLHLKQAQGTLMPPVSELYGIGCPEHRQKALALYDAAVTLVKNTRNQLPITPQTHPRIMLYALESEAGLMKQVMGSQGPSLRDKMKTVLEKAGFSVSVFDFSPGEAGRLLLAGTPVKAFTDKYDAVIVAASVVGFSQSNERRLHWSMPMGPDIPWYVPELPTVFVSFGNPFHLIDVPMVPTYINAYHDNIETVERTVEKIMGKSAFTGISPVDAFCGAWDTRL